MKRYVSRGVRPVQVVVAPEPRKVRTVDRIALVSLVVAALATIASLAQFGMSYLAVDTPYATLVYSEQVKRTVEAVDFMTRLRADVERWEAMYTSADMDPNVTVPEVKERMRHFAELSQGAWLLTPASQQAIGTAARDFNGFAVLCLIPRYNQTGEAPPSCGKMFQAHEASLDAATRVILADVRFDYRRAGAGVMPGDKGEPK